MATGQPNSLPKATTSAPLCNTSLRPGTPLTPAFSAAMRDEILSPITSMASGGGPMNVTAVAVAEEQTAGRGRLGRTWIAPPRSSLLMSLLLRPVGLPADRLHLVTAAVALSAADAVGLVAEVQPTLKWPNDLLIGNRKLAGV